MKKHRPILAFPMIAVAAAVLLASPSVPAAQMADEPRPGWYDASGECLYDCVEVDCPCTLGTRDTPPHIER